MRLGEREAKGDWVTVSKMVKRDACGVRTYTRWHVGVLHKHHHLLGADKAIEADSRLTDEVRISVGVDGGSAASPGDEFGTREEVVHEVLLRGELNINQAFTNAKLAASHHTTGEGVDDRDGLLRARDLDEGVHSLAGVAVHDDVDGEVRGTTRHVDDLGVAAKACEDLILGGQVWDVVELHNAVGMRLECGKRALEGNGAERLSQGRLRTLRHLREPSWRRVGDGR